MSNPDTLTEQKRFMFEMMQRQNMRCITNFHHQLDLALKQKIPEIDTIEGLDKADINFFKREYEVLYPEKLRQTSFLLMFGHLEEMLFLLWRYNNLNSVKLDKGHGISRFKSYIKNVLGDLKYNTDYEHIVHAQKIRNSFLHIAGRVSLSKDRNTLEILARNSQLYSIEMDRIKIEYKGLIALQDAIGSLTESLLHTYLDKNMPCDQ